MMGKKRGKLGLPVDWGMRETETQRQDQETPMQPESVLCAGWVPPGNSRPHRQDIEIRGRQREIYPVKRQDLQVDS